MYTSPLGLLPDLLSVHLFVWLQTQVIKANDDLTPEHHQFFLYQMLRGLKYIHTGKSFALYIVVHT